MALEAFIESAVKAVRALAASVPTRREIVLSGRLARVDAVQRAIASRLEGIAPVRLLEGFASEAKEGAQGAAWESARCAGPCSITSTSSRANRRAAASGS